jgi:plasmid stability protein
MKTIIIKNVPDDVHTWLEKRAAERGRALEEEILRLLEDAQLEEIPDPMVDPEGFLESIRIDIESAEGPGLTLDDIANAIDEGRA